MSSYPGTVLGLGAFGFVGIVTRESGLEPHLDIGRTSNQDSFSRILVVLRHFSNWLISREDISKRLCQALVYIGPGTNGASDYGI